MSKLKITLNKYDMLAIIENVDNQMEFRKFHLNQVDLQRDICYMGLQIVKQVKEYKVNDELKQMIRKAVNYFYGADTELELKLINRKFKWMK